MSHPDDCVLWTKARTAAGYGALRVNGKVVLAHRVAWEAQNGPIPKGGHICHSCDNPPCVNPAHLWLGDPASNAADRNAKGRTVGNTLCVGTRNKNSKLTDAKVREARALASDGVPHRKIAAKFGVSQVAISSAIRGETWSHV